VCRCQRLEHVAAVRRGDFAGSVGFVGVALVGLVVVAEWVAKRSLSLSRHFVEWAR